MSQREIHKTAPKNAYDIIQYHEFCSLHGLKQLIVTPTRITVSKSSLLDHILTNTSENIPQSGVIDIGLSDHQLIFATRKQPHERHNEHKEIMIRSFKNLPLNFIKKP